MRAVLFRSEERFESFGSKRDELGVAFDVLDFDDPDWIEHDFSAVDFVIYYPSFAFTSNHPLALSRVKDDLMHLHARWPHLAIYPDPCLSHYYNDKYRQHMFLASRRYPMPPTIPLVSPQALERAADELGFPLVLKNRFGAGGESVYLASSPDELRDKYRVSGLDVWSKGGLKHLVDLLAKREFYYFLIRARKARYPLLSWPLLAQKFVEMDRDLKVVVGDGSVVEAHWRRRADSEMWKMNIDGGGIGEWARVPPAAIELCERLAADLGARWLNVDLMCCGDEFLIGEFSPVWHHYAYREKDSFVYADDYNIPVPLEQALDLEGLIVGSLIAAGQHAGRR
ncbi:MAG: hypothetical protein GY716_18810 [bacterium]|nr:hypothetical protein [bacterium]